MANLDWTNLSFSVKRTNAIIISRTINGKWTEPEVSHDFVFHMDAFAGVFHYANSCFEGLKAFMGADGTVRIFRPYENANRMARTGAFLDMPYPDPELFVKMCKMCVKENLEFLPPYGYNASMYIRPVLMGANPQLNVESSSESVFAVMCNPVGTYSGNKSLTSVTATIGRNYDRAAPNGTGSYKLSANYAPSFHAYNLAHSQGYKELLFLDPATKTKIDEFGTSNFIGIKGNTFATPLSDSVLPSITNKSLQQLASDCGMNVEKRIIPVEELADFEEVNACGTAVVITPISSIDDKPTLESSEILKTYYYNKPGEVGKTSEKLYNMLRGIQDGTIEDIHNWCAYID